MLTPLSFPSLGQYDVASRTDDKKQLSDEQWFLIQDLFPWQPPSEFGGLLDFPTNGGRWEKSVSSLVRRERCRRVAEVLLPSLNVKRC